jgi:hypothetical protein
MLGQDSYPSLCISASESLQIKLRHIGGLYMSDVTNLDFEYFYNSLTPEELAEFIYVLCNF